MHNRPGKALIYTDEKCVKFQQHVTKITKPLADLLPAARSAENINPLLTVWSV